LIRNSDNLQSSVAEILSSALSSPIFSEYEEIASLKRMPHFPNFQAYDLSLESAIQNKITFI